MKILNPRSEKRIMEDNLWPEGDYSFEIFKAEESKSSKGNDMITLFINVFSNDGKTITVRDYLVEAMALKLRRCVDACNLSEQYEAGQLDAADFAGKAGTLRLGIRSGDDGYPPKNEVKTYVLTNDNKPKSAEIDMDDEIPF